jgi:hypothetical protein
LITVYPNTVFGVPIRIFVLLHLLGNPMATIKDLRGRWHGKCCSYLNKSAGHQRGGEEQAIGSPLLAEDRSISGHLKIF